MPIEGLLLDGLFQGAHTVACGSSFWGLTCATLIDAQDVFLLDGYDTAKSSSTSTPSLLTSES